MTCDKCRGTISGSGFAGSVGGRYCSSVCRSDDEMEVAAQLLAAQMDREKGK